MSKVTQAKILRFLRSDLSQESLNRRLRLSPQQYHRWETGRAVIPWRDFVIFCDLVKAPLKGAFGGVPGYFGDVSNVTELISFYAGHLSQDQLARAIGVSKATAGRWSSGKSDPSLEQVLKLIDIKYSSISFLAALGVDKSVLDPKIVEPELAKRNLALGRPWLAAIVSYLDHEDYKGLKAHRDGFFAEKLKITLPEEKRALKDLLENGVIDFQNGLYLNRPNLKNSYTGGDRAASIEYREYWTNRSLKLLAHPEWTAPVFWPATMSSIDRETLEKIKKRLLDCFHEIGELALQSKKEEMTVVIAMQCIDVETMPVI